MNQKCRKLKGKQRKRLNKQGCTQVCLNKKGFGINEVIGIAAGIIIAAVVVIPGLEIFAGSIMDQLSEWWSSLASSIF